MEVFHESDTVAIIMMLPSFGKHAHLVMGYCYLFGVTPFRLKAKKLRLLLEELKRLFDSESFTLGKRQFSISQAGIAEALSVVVKKNFADGLDSHNYLKKVMIGIAEREGKDFGRSAEKDLRKREAGLMAGRREESTIHPYSTYPVASEGLVSPSADHIPDVGRMVKDIPPARLTDEQIAVNRNRLKTLFNSIGKPAGKDGSK